MAQSSIANKTKRNQAIKTFRKEMVICNKVKNCPTVSGIIPTADHLLFDELGRDTSSSKIHLQYVLDKQKRKGIVSDWIILIILSILAGIALGNILVIIL